MSTKRLYVLVIGSMLAIACGAIALWLWTPDKSRVELEAKYLAAPSDYLDVAGIRLHVRDTGPRDAPAVILLHGLGSSLHTWEPWAQALATKYRVIGFDLPGFGLTGPEPTNDYSDARSLHVLAALMDERGLERASLVGHSMGGRLAWLFAARYPKRVARLILVAPDGFASPGFRYGKAADVPTIVKAMTFVLPKAMLRMNLTPAYADATKLSDATVTRYHDLLLAPQVRGAMLKRMQQTILVRPEPLLGMITAPTLLVWGEKDAMIPMTNAADYLKALPRAELAALPGLGHVPHEEAPAASLLPVEAFLQQ